MNATKWLLGFLWLLPVKVEAQIVTPPTVVFVCEHGTVKSVVAAGLFNKIARERGLAMRAVYRGVSPDADIPAPVRKGLEADGIDVGAFTPNRFAAEDASGVRQLVAFDQPVVSTIITDGRVVEWNGLPPFSDGYDSARTALESRVRALVDALAAKPNDDPAGMVRAFVAAFNARAIDGMLHLTTDDVEWLSVDGPKVAVETAGKDALRKSMASYFKSCATCKSEIEITGGTPTRVAAVETASWQTATGARSQRSLSIYEFTDGKIRRVYYYPAEK